MLYVTSFYCVCLGIFASKLSSVGVRLNCDCLTRLPMAILKSKINKQINDKLKCSAMIFLGVIGAKKNYH